ncbi:FHA domain-containing protein [Spirosoma spitsbergense]|uniref:FHA domain-containing protein n=1 Tax=Spirosoma spitsbergense TaxID=431554 RepID=UPI0003774C2E|nr:FHA domain-containing protein [Spirosoma spitsbergense]
MSVPKLRIVCGNPKCRSPLLVQNPHKLKEAKCPACGFLNPIPEEEAPTQIQNRLPTELGWLIIKDEQTATQTFVLMMGANTIGRQSNLSPSTHMIITNDEFMSRPHCTLTVRIGILGTIEYLLQDGAARDDGRWKFSTNGTYLNGQEQRLSEFDCLYLSDGDIIQIGVTKLVLKTLQLSQSIQKAYRQVEDMDYGRTVIGFKTP